jgi:hypothetical protein
MCIWEIDHVSAQSKNQTSKRLTVLRQDLEDENSFSQGINLKNIDFFRSDVWGKVVERLTKDIDGQTIVSSISEIRAYSR